MSCCPTCRQEIPANSGLILDFDRRLVTARGLTVRVTRHQMIMLRELHVAAPFIVKKLHLISCIWETSEDMPTEPDKTLKVQAARLRTILLPLGLAIITEYGQGYRLVGRAQQIQMSTPSLTDSEAASCKVSA